MARLVSGDTFGGHRVDLDGDDCGIAQAASWISKRFNTNYLWRDKEEAKYGRTNTDSGKRRGEIVPVSWHAGQWLVLERLATPVPVSVEEPQRVYGITSETDCIL